MTLKLGSKGEQVNALQTFLGITTDGDFGANTHAAVKRYQRQHGLTDDGIVGPQTWAHMAIATTDGAERIDQPSPEITINQHFIPEGEFFPGPTTKEWVFLHHTAGWQNPYKVITDWAGDKRGPVATEFVVGGASIKGDNDKFDGEIVQAFPTGGYGWHLGVGNTTMHRNSVGVEVCCFGQLTEGGYTKEVDGANVWIPKTTGKYYTYVGTEAHPNQIEKLPQPFRGFSHWHRYSNTQLVALKELILYIASRDSIDVRKGLPELIKEKGAQAFDFCDVNHVSTHPGLWCHANVSTSKVDMFPQPELMDMLLEL